MSYADFAARVTGSGIISDPWLEGEPRFRPEPVLLAREDATALCTAAEAMGAVYNELALRVAAEPEHLDAFFRMTPHQKVMWLASAPSWHGIARADVFMTANGPLLCELNSDTPSGEAEAFVLNEIARRAEWIDPNAELPARFVAMLEATTSAVLGQTEGLRVGIVYPTELTEDLSMIAIYRRWLEARGWSVVLGSPFNLTAKGRKAALFGQPCDLLVRHYKTDWWGERVPVWDDANDFMDAEPLAAPLAVALGAETCVVNPFGSVLTQNKRAMAFMHEEIDRFPAWAKEAILRYLPRTVRLEHHLEEVAQDKDGWVLKSDYGCEGDEVVLGVECSEEEWTEALLQATPGRWVAQRYFEAAADDEGMVVNHGVFLVAGEAAGFFSRVHEGHTDYCARTAPTMVLP